MAIKKSVMIKSGSIDSKDLRGGHGLARCTAVWSENRLEATMTYSSEVAFCSGYSGNDWS